MTEDEARKWLRDHFDVSRETWERLEGYIALLLDEAERQNLISASTKDHIWSRHIVDSAQLLLQAPNAAGAPLWADLGAGAGLPGIVVAILSGYRVAMIEMRRKRVEFLQRVIETLHLANASAHFSKVEKMTPRMLGGAAASIISARAYAPMERLVASAHHLADKHTIWLLPKGQNFENELAIAQRLWHSDAHTVQSVTAPDSAILVLRNIRKRGN